MDVGFTICLPLRYPAFAFHIKLEVCYYFNPCGGGVEYLHRDPASRKRRRNGTKKKAAP
jgi:hypothetical protein